MQQNQQVRQQKAETRKRLKKIRAELPDGIRLDYNNSITEQVLKLNEVQSSKIIFIYISYATEVHTHALMRILLDVGKTLVVPKIIDSDFMQAESLSRWEDLIPAELGILTTANSNPYSGSFDIAIVPGLGFTISGHRIGFGRGYYDKWFAQNKVDHKIALAYEIQLIEDIPVENTDVPMEKIVTEKRVITV